MDKIVLDGELSLNIPLDGEVGLMSLIEVGISEIRFNSDYTITFVMTDGRTFTSEPVRGESGAKGEKGDKGDPGNDYNLTEQDKQDIAGLVDTPVDDVQLDGNSIVQNGIANIPIATYSSIGAVRANADYGISVTPSGRLGTTQPTEAQIKTGTIQYRTITPKNQHISTFYGLAKSAGADEKDSTLPVGEYSEEAKAAIRAMLGIDKDSLIAEIRDALNL